MRTQHLLASVLLSFALLSGASAQAGRAVPAEDAKAIAETIETFGSALTKMDFPTFGTVLTDDCDWVNIVGMHWHGKAQVVKGHSVVFTTRYRGVPLHVLDQSEALLSDTLALVVSTLKLDDYTAQDGKRMTDNVFRITWVMEKQAGRWLVRSGQNTIVDAEAAKHDPGKPRS